MSQGRRDLHAVVINGELRHKIPGPRDRSSPQ
jgi:hypothetical protein